MRDETIFAISAMLWSRYSDAAKKVKLIQSEKNNGSPNWQQFHNSRLENALYEMNYSYELYQDYTAQYGEQIKKMMAKD